MNKFILELDRLDMNLKKYNLDCYNLLAPPLPEEQIVELLNKLKIKNDDNVLSLYKWKNGTTLDKGRPMLFENITKLVPLNEVYDNNNLNLPYTKQFTDNGLFIFFSNEEDHYLFNNNEGEDYGKIYLYNNVSFTDENPVAYYDSLLTMIETTNELYENGALIYNYKNQFLETDFELAHMIYKKFNPLCDFNYDE